MERSQCPKWRFIHTGNRSGAYNMAVDEAIVRAVSEGRAAPTLRFYGWEPATLSIGYFQRADKEVDLAAVIQQGYGFVRRPTGGRAVLHDRELTYSMIVPEDYPGIPTTVNEAYRVLSEGLVLGFRALGLQAEMVRLDEEADRVPAASSAACFDSPSWYELVVEGRKIAGSAQTRKEGVVLQHGSILLELDVEALFSLLRFSNERVREKLQSAFVEKAVAVNEICRRAGLPEVELDQAEAAFKGGISEALGIEWEDTELTPWELAEADRLVIEKYGTEEWNLRR